MSITSDKGSEEPIPSIPPPEADVNTYGFPRGYFVLRSIGTGRVLDVCQGLKEDGTAIVLWPATESSLVESMRKPEADNQVFFIDTSGALSSRSAGHAIDVEGESLVLRYRKPVTLPFPNAYSHPLPRFAYHPNTKEITITFASDPSQLFSLSERRESTSGAWKEKTYYLSSVPMRKPPTLIDNASALLTSAMISGPFSFFGNKKMNATPEAVFDGEIDLAEDELAEQDRNDAEEMDDSPEPLRPVKAIALIPEEVGGASEKAKLRRQWEVLPLRNTRHRTGGSS